MKSSLLAAALAAALPGGAAMAQTAEDLVGRWGLASYFRDADSAQVARAARSACSAPYTIARAPGGGVLLNEPDRPAKTEHVIKTSWSGGVFIGPPGEAGGVKDRVFVSFSPDQFVLRWVDPTVANRYGVMVFVRCGRR
jgi:hypothetical protein